MTIQPYNDRELFLFECEAVAAKAVADAPKQRLYHVTREVDGQPFTTCWTEQLVRYFLHRYAYRDIESWLECFSRDEGSYTDFGWVKERKQA
jgi:hypothetical protein